MFVTEHEIGVWQCGVDLDIYEKRLWKRGGQPGPFFGHVGTGSCLSFSVWRAESSHDRGAWFVSCEYVRLGTGRTT